jgi:hypothetical protein
LRSKKQIKRLIREYAGKAYELELREALAPLADAFRAWERGEVNSFELESLIHRFHQDAAREIYKRYSLPATAVARAFATGVLARESAPAELIEDLAGWIAFFEKEPE